MPGLRHRAGGWSVMGLFAKWGGTPARDDDPTDYGHIGKSGRQMSRELRDAAADLSKRRINGLDTEDQSARVRNLREAKGRLN
ncbi:hypothetical protein DMP17_22335 [Pseudonocardia sp. TMWB2A]